MTAFIPTEHNRVLRHQGRDPVIELFLSDLDGAAGKLAGGRSAGHLCRLSPIHPSAEIEPEALTGAAAAVVEVAADDPESVARFQKLAATAKVPLIAAAYEAPLSLVRTLIRAGAKDVLPLPIEPAELDSTLTHLLAEVSPRGRGAAATRGKLVSVIKSGGGVGATALLTQLAVLHAQNVAQDERDTCLVDLDLQFGDAAFQLGLYPALSVVNLLEAGARLDFELLQAATLSHASGLKLIGAPTDMLPLDAVPCDQLLEVVDVALDMFGMVFLDLPANWTDWSMSLVARSDLVLLVTELTVPALRQTRRQLDLLNVQDLRALDLRIVANRHEERLIKNLKPADVRQALGRGVDYTVSNDPALIRAAIDQGVPITEVRRRSRLAKDLGKLAAEVAAIRQES